MNEKTKRDDKLPTPSSHVDKQQPMLEDPSLSKARKAEALNVLEQDARQMAEATLEGMSGGERNALHEVLIAKKTLDLPQAV
jgi:hypothetical protein